MHDELGDRMKGNYEDRTRFSLPRRTYTIIRLDGKAFHTYTRGLKKPFDADLFEDIDKAIIDMLPSIQGAQFAYTESDEISILLTDFEKPTTDAWFDGNLQKICSVSSSIMTAEFNRFRTDRRETAKIAAKEALDITNAPIAYFDARVFTIPDRTEVMNYFIWRNNDCARNSVSMVAQSMFSHKDLQGKGTSEMHEMIHRAGKNWATDYSDGEKNGRLIVKEEYTVSSPIVVNGKALPGPVNALRTRWVSKPAWKFTEDKDKLLAMIPKHEN